MRLVRPSSLAFACTLALVGQARANDVTFTGFAHGSETVTFSLVAPNVTTSGTALAGGFATILNGGPSFVTYCVDVYQHISFGSLYPEYGAPGTTPRLHQRPRLCGPRTPVRQRRRRGHQRRRGRVPNRRLGDRLRDDARPLRRSASGAASFSGGCAASSGALGLASDVARRARKRRRPHDQRDRERRAPGRHLCAGARAFDLDADDRRPHRHGRGSRVAQARSRRDMCRRRATLHDAGDLLQRSFRKGALETGDAAHQVASALNCALDPHPSLKEVCYETLPSRRGGNSSSTKFDLARCRNAAGARLGRGERGRYDVHGLHQRLLRVGLRAGHELRAELDLARLV